MTASRPTLKTKASSARIVLPPLVTDLSSASAFKDLDFLIAFYQRERAWARETRASLQSAFRLGRIRPDDNWGRDHETSGGECNKNESGEEEGHEETDRFEPAGEGETRATKSSSPSKESPELESEITKSAPTMDRAPEGIWEKRKLKRGLYGLGSAPRILPSQRGLHILEMFGNIMEDRMESCQRIDRLVRKANRRDLLAAAYTK